jgi:hypothetical protein
MCALLNLVYANLTVLHRNMIHMVSGQFQKWMMMFQHPTCPVEIITDLTPVSALTHLRLLYSRMTHLHRSSPIPLLFSTPSSTTCPAIHLVLEFTPILKHIPTFRALPSLILTGCRQK